LFVIFQTPISSIIGFLIGASISPYMIMEEKKRIKNKKKCIKCRKIFVGDVEFKKEESKYYEYLKSRIIILISFLVGFAFGIVSYNINPKLRFLFLIGFFIYFFIYYVVFVRHKLEKLKKQDKHKRTLNEDKIIKKINRMRISNMMDWLKLRRSIVGKNKDEFKRALKLSKKIDKEFLKVVSKLKIEKENSKQLKGGKK
jgi:Ca2+/Na+ antiporter